MVEDKRDMIGNEHIEYLLMALDSDQWKSLCHIRCRPYPVSVQDKRKLLDEITII